jgi:hypothetical protein
MLGVGTEYPEIFRGTSQSLLENTVSVHRLGHDHFLPVHV